MTVSYTVPCLTTMTNVSDQWTAHALGIRHFAVQHDDYRTAPNLYRVDYPEGFQGDQITVKGQVVADLIEARLTGKA